ncbi:MAG: hypothetical protein JXA60_04430 [Candidatus Coatesbacteria bacterium]|nr:hypothetical protein [Candidatus Coatesbacteria bacterium]
MLSVRGIYQKGEIVLQEKVAFSEPMKVIVTFLDEIPEQSDSQIKRFSFVQSRKLLSNVSESIADEGLLK